MSRTAEPTDLRRRERRRRPAGARARVARQRPLLVTLAVLGAVAAAWWFTLGRSTRPTPGLGDILQRIAGFVGDLTGTSATGPTAYQQTESWRAVGGLAGDTLVMSVIAMGIAALVTLATVAFSSRLMTLDEFGPRHRAAGALVYAAVRGLHVVCRSVPELIWALLIVFILRPGVLAGALALALHEIGVLGRLVSDVVDDVEREPLRALRSSGAGSLQVLFYGVLPQALPQFITFLLYRWEIAIRATVIVGFITAAGLGYQLRLDLSFRRWTEVGLILVVYVLLVWGVELIASGLRRLAR